MFQLREDEQKLLLQIARQAVQARVLDDLLDLPPIPDGPLKERNGAFVSIHRGEELRGCIGNLQPETALYQTVRDCAMSAAFEDPRFPPVNRVELRQLLYEISILSPMVRVQDIGEIEVGRDGLLVRKRSSRGLLLPQVATRLNWTVEKFLGETCQKAGLHENDWKSDTEIYRFTALVFDETQQPSTRA